jgi:1-aminocyclopropane-1-carboxylate deaminase/D-cysteine desulfhydrase-like pyridoxal-dependent ACC family enzyme
MDRSLLFSKHVYQPPVWITDVLTVQQIPQNRINLGQLPTPIQRLHIGNNFDRFSDIFSYYGLWIKRDDISSFDISGNKLRKLEFLLGNILLNN